ncbi:hypothetical protein EVG20_g2077 [Dentipellis fragilis]|uniref:Uncharacterized protein n=1 Tax=Dentipellis fragilis TaxID=205917 RepID=A0A4Y9Z9V1_9AGAM|nr:hypothetical protein EVG20_g2077 [Dentipellis fragilis]
MPGRSSLESATSAGSLAPRKKKGTRQPRSFSASEIARNAKNFETWSSFQGCEEVAFSDMPAELVEDVSQVFVTTGYLPYAWVDKTSKAYRRIKSLSSPEYLSFIQKAYEKHPELFSDEVKPEDCRDLFDDMRTVFVAWKRLLRMRASKEKFCEADFVANVYDVFRSPALSSCSYRSKCSISLSQPLRYPPAKSQACRVLNAKLVIPDCAVFIPAIDIRNLSHAADSPFKRLKRSSLTRDRGSSERSFGNQSTPCSQLPTSPAFEFASSFWEDKKPVHQMLEDAYRQNRMATAAAVRHLHSLHIMAPVFGLVWSDGTVRAHVDWCVHDKNTIVRSAPYPSSIRNKDGDCDIFHEWRLDNPWEIIQVFLLIRNIDRWTVGRFRERVNSGIQDLLHSVLTEKQRYRPWKRVGALNVLSEIQQENSGTSANIQHSSPEANPGPKRRHRRRS